MARRSTISMLLAIAGLAVVLASCDEGNPAAQTYELRGRVFDRADDRGVGGAQVTFVSETGVTVESTSGDGGAYQMAIRSDSPFGQVRAEKDGWLADERTVFFDSSLRRVDLGLRRLVAEE